MSHSLVWLILNHESFYWMFPGSTQVKLFELSEQINVDIWNKKPMMTFW